MSLQTPILFLVFNRPDTTKKVFEEIRKQKPQKLYIAADGPRNGNNEDIDNCYKVKELFKSLDWDCDVKTLFRTKNLGCKIAVSEGIDWFFENVEEGIILEDDVLPTSSFFTFCEDMLAMYREDKEIMHISGFNPLYSWKEKEQSYHFSYFGNIWGWATWKRSWSLYDVNIKLWGDKKNQNKLLKTFFPLPFRDDRKKLYNDLFRGEIDTLDYQWTFCRLMNECKSIISSINLIENIGFDLNATHTKIAPSWAKIKKSDIQLPYRHPKLNKVDKDYDLSHLNLNNNILPKKKINNALSYLRKITQKIIPSKKLINN